MANVDDDNGDECEIEEARRQREKLEEDIWKAIKKFQDKTGLVVTRVNIDTSRYQSTSRAYPQVGRVEAVVKL